MESDYPPNFQIMRNDKDNVIANKIPGFIWGLIYAFSNFQILKLIH